MWRAHCGLQKLERHLICIRFVSMPRIPFCDDRYCLSSRMLHYIFNASSTIVLNMNRSPFLHVSVGIACTAADCTPGTLEHALLAEAATLNIPTYKRLNVPHLCGGALYVAWTQAEADGPLRDLWKAHSGSGGAGNAKWLDDQEAIAAVACGGGGGTSETSGVCDGAVAAVHVAGEVTVDPWLVPVAWITQAEVNGACSFRRYRMNA